MHVGPLGRGIPTLVAEVDLTSLPLGSLEGFVLSRIDGRVSLEELVDLVGLPRNQVEAAIGRLTELGAVRMEPGSDVERTARADRMARAERPASGVRTPGRAPERPSAPPSAGSAAAPEPPPLYDPKELEEKVDLSLERRKKVLGVFYQLDRLSHYGVLEVPDWADKGQIRHAYFALSKLVHPDTMYGRELGSFKTKMEAIFRSATDAYEVLSRGKRRAAYDDEVGLPPLEERMAARPPADEPSPAPEEGPESGRGMPNGPRSSVRPRPPFGAPGSTGTPGGAPSAQRPREASPAAPAGPPGTVAQGSSTTAAQGSSTTAAQGSSTTAARAGSSPHAPASSRSVSPRASSPEVPRAPSGADAQRPSHPPGGGARRETQERVLQEIARVTGRARVPSSVGPTPRTAPESSGATDRRNSSVLGRESVLRGLASSLRDAGRVTGTDRVDKHLRAATDAERAGDLVAACNALRLARDLLPNDRSVGERYERVRFALVQSQAETYEKQAQREEKMEMWGPAALSWSNVADGRPTDAQAHCRAAYCLWRCKGDLKRARDLAQRAVDLVPRDAQARTVLARIYLEAGMRLNARRELEAAAKLDPADEIVKNLLRELK